MTSGKFNDRREMSLNNPSNALICTQLSFVKFNYKVTTIQFNFFFQKKTQASFLL